MIMLDGNIKTAKLDGNIQNMKLENFQSKFQSGCQKT